MKKAAIIMSALLAGGIITPAAEAYPTGGALSSVQTLVLSVFDGTDVPSDAIGVAMNVTVTNPDGPGFLTVYPCGSSRPLASNLNYVKDQTVPNFVLSAISPDGTVCIDTMTTTDVIVDLAGYVPSGSPLVFLPTPDRFLDTRSGVGSSLGRVHAGTVLSVPIAGRHGVPVGAGTVVFNVTAVQPSRRGFLTVFPCGQPIPETSTLNFDANQIVPNMVTASVGQGGAVCFYSISDVDIVGDVTAYLPDGTTGATLFGAPRRIVDTRIGLNGIWGPITPEATAVSVRDIPGIPRSATTLIANITATEGKADGWMRAFPCNREPVVSNVNFKTGQDIANQGYIGLDFYGFCAKANQPVQLVIDIAGYFTGNSVYLPLTPLRIFDSREGVDPPCNLGIRYDATAQRYRWIDLASGADGSLLPAVAAYSWIYSEYANTSPILGISGDCRTVVVRGDDKRIYALDRSGRTLGSVSVLPNFLIDPTKEVFFYSDSGVSRFTAALVDRPDGSSVVMPAVVDLDGNVDAYFPDVSATDDHFLGASDDLSTFVFWHYNATNQPVFDTYDSSGSRISEGAGPVSAITYQMVLSPDANYITLHTQIGDNRERPLVITTTGEIVASAPLKDGADWVAPQMTWMTSGSLAGCATTLNPNGGRSGARAIRWDLFSPPRQLSPNRRDAPCLEIAR